MNHFFFLLNFSLRLPSEVGREHPGEEHRQLGRQHHPTLQGKEAFGPRKAHVRLGNPRSIHDQSQTASQVLSLNLGPGFYVTLLSDR